MPIHLQEKMKDFRKKKLPNSEKIWDSGLALPIHQEVAESDILKIYQALSNET